MVQILPGGSFWQGMGASVGSGLGALAKQKYDENVVEQGLSSLGFNPEEAKNLSRMDPRLLQTVVKERLALPRKEMEAMAYLSPFLGNIQAPQQQFMSGRSAFMPGEGPGDVTGLAIKPEGKPEKTFSFAEQPKQQGLQALQQPIQKAESGLQRLTEQSMTQPERQLTPEMLTYLKHNPQAAKELSSRWAAEDLAMKQMASREKIAQRRIEGAEKRQEAGFKREEQKEWDKEGREYVGDVNRSAEAANEEQAALGLIKDITEKKGEGFRLVNTVVDRLKEGIHVGPIQIPLIDLTFLKTPGAQLIDKAAMSLQRHMKDIYGARVTNMDVQNFMASIPTLSNSRNGRLQLVEMWLAANALKQQRANVAKQIINDYQKDPSNKGHMPPDLQIQVMERMRPYYDGLTQRMKVIAEEATPSYAPSNILSNLASMFGLGGA